MGEKYAPVPVHETPEIVKPAERFGLRGTDERVELPRVFFDFRNVLAVGMNYNNAPFLICPDYVIHLAVKVRHDNVRDLSSFNKKRSGSVGYNASALRELIYFLKRRPGTEHVRCFPGN